MIDKIIFIVFILLLLPSGAEAISTYSNEAIYVYGDTIENMTTINRSISNPSYLESIGDKEWLLKVPMIIDGASVQITDDDTKWLKLENQNDNITMINVLSGNLNISNVEVSSWNGTPASIFINGKLMITNSKIHDLGDNLTPALHYSSSEVIIKNSNLYNLSGYSWSGGIYASGSNRNGLISNNHFSNIGGIFLNYPRNYEINNNIVNNSFLVIIKGGSNNAVRNNVIDVGYTANSGIKQYDGGSDGHIFNNTVFNAKRYGIHLYADTRGHKIENFTLEKNTLYDNLMDGINIYGRTSGVQNLKIIDNIIYNNPGDGIFLHGVGGTISDFIIENNTIMNTIDNSVDGIAIDGHEHSGLGSIYNGIVKGNTINHNSHRNIYLVHNVSNITVTDNDLSDSLDSGIKLDDFAFGNNISNNVISDVKYGIRFQYNSSNNIAHNNIIKDTLSNAIVVYFDSLDNSLISNEIVNTRSISIGTNSKNTIVKYLKVENTKGYDFSVKSEASADVTLSRDKLVMGSVPKTVIIDTNNINFSVISGENIVFNFINMSIAPSSNFLNVTVLDWITSDDFLKSWKESSENLPVTSYHIIGDFPPNTEISLRKNNVYWKTFVSNSSGYISFTYDTGYNNNFDTQFDAEINSNYSDVVTQQNQQPVANAGLDKTADVNTIITFDGSGSNDPDGTISAYEWDFGDETIHRTGITTTHAYSTAGTYTVILKTTDSDGAIDTDTASVIVKEIPSLPTMHIASIVMSSTTKGYKTFATALVTIVDKNGSPVEGAIVKGYWSHATNDFDLGVTLNGEVSMNSDKVKNAKSGTIFTFTVTDVSLTGWEYDTSSNAIDTNTNSI